MARGTRRWTARAASVAVGLALTAAAARGADVTQEFVEALCRNQLHDVAVEYLESLRSSPRASEAIKQTISYQQGAALLQAAALAHDFAVKEKLFDEARLKLNEFLKQQPGHELVGSARSQLAALLMERGRARVGQAAGAAESQRPKLLGEARQLLTEGQAALAAAQQQFEGKLKAMPKIIAPQDEELRQRKDQAARDLARTLLLGADADFELAQTHPVGSEPARKHLKSAAEKYAHLSQEVYRTQLPGLVAHLREGICYKQLGDARQALGCFQDLLDLPAEHDTRFLRTSALRHALECWVSERKLSEAIGRGQQWLSSATPAQLNEPDGLAIRYFVAMASHQEATARSAKDPIRSRFADVARQQVAQVAKHPGEYQQPARALLVALGGDTKPEQQKEPATFAEAYQRASEALEAMKVAAAGAQIATENGNEEQVPQLRRQEKENLEIASRYFQMALGLADKKAKLEDVNKARYFVCALLFNRGDLLDAAVIGDYLARTFPESEEGRRGALVAMRAYVRLYLEAKDGDKSFEAAAVMRLADTINQRWPDQEEAREAAQTMLSFAIHEHKFAKALAYLEKIPQDSPQRGPNELLMGQSFWAAYLKAMQVLPAERPPKAELDQIKQHAERLLTAGLARVAGKELDASTVAAMLAVARIYVDGNQPAKTLALLENKDTGLLKLLEAKSPLVAREGYALEIQQLALQAYVAVQPPQIKKAETAMNALESLAGKSGDAGTNERLTKIYIALGAGLQRQLQELRSAGKQDAVRDLAKGFELFLDRIVKREKGNDFRSLSWAAEYYYSLGAGLDDGSQSAPPAARGHYEKAAQTYQRILAAAAADPAFLPQADMVVALRLRLVTCLSRGGKYDDAIRTIAELIKDKPAMLLAQTAAAETLMAKGAVDPRAYLTAIGGAEPDKAGKNLIWGWGRISQLTRGNPKLIGAFHEARLKIGECYYRNALAAADAAKRNSRLQDAKRSIRQVFALYHEMGGAETAAKYDALLKSIQQALGEQAAGLEEFRQAEAQQAAQTK